MSCDVKRKEDPINQSAECGRCMHFKTCSRLKAMNAINDEFMNESMFDLPRKPIDIDMMARHCNMYVNKVGKYAGVHTYAGKAGKNTHVDVSKGDLR